MDRRQFFGDSVAGTLIRLVLLSVIIVIVPWAYLEFGRRKHG